MSILFGTDGIRGEVGLYPITPEFFFELGKVIAEVFKHYHRENELPKFLVASDTRISSDMLQTALASGCTSMGSDIIFIGQLPTPAVAYLTRELAVSGGIMITASHNPFYDNGVKIFDSLGYKISDKVQEHIEKLLMTKATVGKVADNGVFGRIIPKLEAKAQYIELLKNHCDYDAFKGLKIVLDCANGVASRVAPELFVEFGAQIITIGDKPDGININQKVGATHPHTLIEQVIKNKADIGIALDGDADRVIFVDKKGQVINGDKILAFIAIILKKQNKLAKDTLVLTQMSNLGIINSLRQYDINVITTLIGDRYVMEEMRHGQYSLGGENSGHIIFADASSTGDGILSAIKVVNFMFSKSINSDEIFNSLETYPYHLLNIEVESKPPIETLPNVEKLLIQCEEDLGQKGRYLLRYSGTENKIRILVEAKDESKVRLWIDKITQVVKKDIN